MAQIIQAADDNWIGAFIVFLTILLLCRYGYRALWISLRHKTIQAKGWPPAHCDADGDFKTDDDEPREGRLEKLSNEIKNGYHANHH